MPGLLAHSAGRSVESCRCHRLSRLCDQLSLAVDSAKDLHLLRVIAPMVGLTEAQVVLQHLNGICC
eukprot:1816330-Lingulodinium_polyedra.AAC.1